MYKTDIKNIVWYFIRILALYNVSVDGESFSPLLTLKAKIFLSTGWYALIHVLRQSCLGSSRNYNRSYKKTDNFKESVKGFHHVSEKFIISRYLPSSIIHYP